MTIRLRNRHALSWGEAIGLEVGTVIMTGLWLAVAWLWHTRLGISWTHVLLIFVLYAGIKQSCFNTLRRNLRREGRGGYEI